LIHSIEEADFSAAAKILHSQKGAWGNLGATPLYRQICSLETLAQENRLSLNCRQWLAYQQLYAQTRKAAEHWLQHYYTNETSHTRAPAAAELNTAGVWVENFLQLLDEHSLRACDQYEQLKTHFSAHLDAESAHQLDNAMHNLHFPLAAQILREQRVNQTAFDTTL
ncbi:MAG TPA: hypothetical protein PKD17_10630, partial [Cellvibrionaceae bacterium]|nr:hypothetical protein [Cellvibrionaceae bacterium]